MKDKVFIVVEHVMDAFDNILRTRTDKAFRHLQDAEVYAMEQNVRWNAAGSFFMISDMEVLGEY